jgi:hypothetical protein
VEDAVIEQGYNLFVYCDASEVKEVGVAVHELNGTDQEKLLAMRNLVDTDFQTATRYKLKRPMSWQYYEGLGRLGRELEIFEELFVLLDAPKQPLVVITPILNEKPRFDAVTKLGPLMRDDLKGTLLEEPGRMVDYLEAYMTDKGFDASRLLNDDYFHAIKLLINNRHYVSSAKLLMSFIDTIAFIDAGDVKNGFVNWLNAFADLSSLGITSKELWEFRNGLLHMTNLRSRAVAKGDVPPLIISVGISSKPLPPYRNGAKRINLKALIVVVAEAVSKWIETYNQSPDKWPDFVSRYDLTVSDSRVAFFELDEAADSSVLVAEP